MPKTGRNDQCPCGSGSKFKKCCEPKLKARSSRLLMIIVGASVLAALLVAGLAMVSETQGGGSTRVWDPAHGHYHDASGQQVP